MRYGVVLIAAGLVAQDPMVIRVPVRLVAVPTLVYSRDNKLIPGLKKSDFRIFDNGVPQQIDLDTDDAPVSVVIAIQTNRDVHESLPFIAKVGSVMEAHLVGATGRAAVIAYNGEVKVLKAFGSGDVRWAFRDVRASGLESRAIDAGMEAIAILQQRPRTQARVLLYIGQAMDRGSQSSWAELEQEADRENVAIYGLISSDAKNDPLSPLIAATGGTQLHFRHQPDLENAIGELGVELRSAYLLSYYPSSADAGKHSIAVEVSVPGAKTRARPGYSLSPN
jgi:VWFA-related protein